MYANYHAHTWRCNHAWGTEREYIEAAIEAGIRVLGFSDHTPNPCSWNINDDIRMTMAQTEGYFTLLQDYKREYAADIAIHVGVEAEYQPAGFEHFLDYLKPFGCEYMLLGQHYMDGEHVRACVKAPAQLAEYVRQLIEGIQTGVYLYLAHPDLAGWHGDDAIYRMEMEKLCKAAKALNCPLEFNLLGFRNRRNYPDGRFWPLAAENGNRVILGIDAHELSDMRFDTVEQEAREYLAGLGITPIERLSL